MNDFAVLTNEGEYTVFEFIREQIRFSTSKRLERYTKILEWDHGYLVVKAKYKDLDEVEEYIDLIPILEDLYYDDDLMVDIIKSIRNLFPDCAITLSLGEKSKEPYQK